MVGDGDIAAEGNIHDPFAVRRRVGEPVAAVVFEGDLLGVAAVGAYAPELHISAARRVEPDEAAVGRIIGTVVHPFALGELGFAAARDRAGPQIENAVTARRDISQRLTVRRPAVPIRRRLRDDETRLPAAGRENPQARQAVGLAFVADDQPFAVGRQAVVVVELGERTGVDLDRHPAVHRQAIEQTPAVEDEMGTTMRPVGRLDVIVGAIYNPPRPGGDVHHLQPAFHLIHPVLPFAADSPRLETRETAGFSSRCLR